MGWNKRLSLPTVIVGGFAAIVFVSVLVVASTSSAPFSAYNSGWNGASELQTQARAMDASSTIVRDTSAYSNGQANETVAIILSPTKSYDVRDRTRIRRFVERGGTLVVADDFGAKTNVLLGNLGAQTRLDERLLRDERYNYRTPAMPIARNVSNPSLVSNASLLTLNRGTVLHPNNATVLVSSSTYAYLDSNRNGKLDTDETVGERPVATVESIGRGRTIVVSDSSIFINAMLDRTGNRAFVRSIVDGNDHVLLDYSHSKSLPPVAIAILTLRNSLPLQFVVTFLCLGLVFVWMEVSFTDVTRHIPVLYSKSETAIDVELKSDEIASYLEAEYPTWDDEKIDRVVRAFQDQRR